MNDSAFLEQWNLSQGVKAFSIADLTPPEPDWPELEIITQQELQPAIPEHIHSDSVQRNSKRQERRTDKQAELSLMRCGP